MLLGVIQQLRGQNCAIFCPLTKTDIFDPLPPHLVHVVIEWPLMLFNIYCQVGYGVSNSRVQN